MNKYPPEKYGKKLYTRGRISKCCNGWAYKRAEYMVKEGAPLDSGEFRAFWMCSECNQVCQILNRHERASLAFFHVSLLGKVFCLHDWSWNNEYAPDIFSNFLCRCTKCGSEGYLTSPPLEPIDEAEFTNK